ncbi:MAG: ATP-binding protein [Firmicutes bacterium]|nr:ATP-binding protein [Bacillota bacterium]
MKKKQIEKSQVEKLEKTQKEKEKLQKEKQDFFINASHELNTPLTSILGYAEILKKEKAYKEEFVDAIYKQALRMLALISDMLLISELEEMVEFPKETLCLKQIAMEICETHAPKAESKNIKLVTNLEPVTLKANKEKIVELISNLVDNSIKYTNNGGLVEITVKNNKGRPQIIVKDNGIGIEKKHQKRVFERFYRTDKGRSRQEGGTGLGLAIVKHICNLYGAAYTINSEENVGTQITIEF